MCVVAGAVGALAGGVGSLVGAAGGGGGGPSAPSGSNSNFNEVFNPQSLGQTLTGVLSGGLSAGLGISGLAGGNLNQLQAGAAAANPFGQYAQGFVNPLQQLLQGGLQGTIYSDVSGLSQMQRSIAPSAAINTGIPYLQGLYNISTPGATGALTNLSNNPLSAAPSGIQSILAQNPYGFTPGEQFQYTQGLNALNASKASQGLLGSGNQDIALTQYGQGFASQAVQQNIQNLFGANTQANQSLSTQSGVASTLANILSQQQQNTFGNQLGIHQLSTQQQQATFGNLSQLLSQALGINTLGLNATEGLLGPLMTTSQASLSSPATAGGILANLGVANQGSAGNVASGIGGLASGLGGLGSGLSNLFGGGGGNNFTGDFSTGGGFATTGGYNPLLFGPSSMGGGFDFAGSGGNTFGFTM